MLRMFLILLSAGFTFNATAQIWLEKTRIDPRNVASGLNVPWDMEWWSSDEILFTELGGDIKRVNVTSGDVDTLLTIPDLAREGQAGLMGLQAHPQWPDSAYWYAAHTYYEGTNILLRIVKLEYDDANDELIIASNLINDLPSASSNAGCRLLIDDDGYLFVTMGDLKANDDAQNPDKLNGKVLRYELSGAVPSDNPIPGNPVYTWGHRNPQGIAQTENGNILISEHGPSSNDEVSLLSSGGNFGWPLVLGYCTSTNQDVCDSINAIDPLTVWSPTIAPAGVEYFNSPMIPEWENSLLVTALKAQQMLVLNLDAAQSSVTGIRSFYINQYGRLRDVLSADDGRIFLATSNRDEFGTPQQFDDLIVELTPSAHNGVDEPGEVIQHTVDAHGVSFSEPFTGTLSVYDMTGRIVLKETSNHTSSIPVNWSQFKGMMILTLETNDTRLTKKIQLY